MSDFLENLKKSVEAGEFNSEAAKKIIEINEKVKEIYTPDITGSVSVGKIDAILEKAGLAKPVTEEEAVLANSKYEEDMKKIKEEETTMKIAATLTNVEQLVRDSMIDMYDYMCGIEKSIEDGVIKNNETLSLLIDKIKTDYKDFI